MGRKFISILGTSDYKECTYTNGQDSIKTRFIQEALITMYMKDAKPEDKIIILLTKKARENNWEDKKSKDDILNMINRSLKSNNVSGNDIEKIKHILEADKSFENKAFLRNDIGLKTILQNKFKNIQIVNVDIEDGNTEEEIWSIFEKIYINIDENDEVIFDITHGFRSIPMLALTVINYAKVIKNITLKGIYYGAFEARNKETNAAPIFNLTSYNDILEWTSAVDTFVSYGNGTAIKNSYEELSKRKSKEGNYELSKSNIKKIVSNINSFTSCIETSRGKIATRSEGKLETKRINKSTYNSAKAIKKSLEQLKEENMKLVKPLVPLFDKVNETIDRFCIENNEEIGIEIIRWCIEYGLIQQGYTALDETIKTFVCNKYNLNEINEDTRDGVVKAAMNSIYNAKGNRNNNEYKGKEEYLNEYELVLKTIPNDIVNLVEYSRYRNDISHFGYTKVVLDYEMLSRKLKEGFDKFIEIREKYKNIKLDTDVINRGDENEE